MPDGGIGALRNSGSSVSVHPLKLTTYPPNGTFFCVFGFPGFPFAFASPFVVSGGRTLSVAVGSSGRLRGCRPWRRSRSRTSLPPGNADQRTARFRRASADFWPAARAAARFSGDVTTPRADV